MPNTNPVAVIDIGSNSVRLVIYDGLKHALMPVFNEKILCALAKDLEKTGHLHIEGVKRASDAIRRFLKIAKIMGVKSSLYLFATAAVRDASDGKKFVKDIKDKYGANIEIFSGEEEAKYAALGVVSSMQNVKGFVGDLGGGSLEVIDVNKKNLGNANSLPIGPLRLLDLNSNVRKYEKIVEKHLNSLPWNEDMQGENFYFVGGAFRNLAKFHMSRKNYPLKVLHNYKIAADEFEETVKIVAKMSTDSIAKISSISKKRQNFLPYAAMLAGKIIEFAKPKNVIFSTTGVREGFLFSKNRKESKMKML